MKYIDKTLDIITFTAKAIAGTLLAIMLIVSVVEVFRRYLFNATFQGSEELVRFSLVWVSFLGGAAAYRHGGLVLIGLLVDRLPKKAKAVVSFLTNTSVLLFCLYMLNSAWKYTFTSSVSKQVAIGLGIPMKLPYFGIVLGLILIIIFSLDNYRRLIPDVFGKEGG